MTGDESERALLAERVLAEQEERRRLAELLHDGPVQHLSAIAQMLDASLTTLRDGDAERAGEILDRGLGLAREAARELRALCEDLEPDTLRSLGFAATVAALARRISARHGVVIEHDVEEAETLGEGAQLALFQILREAIDQSVRRGAPTRIVAWVKAAPNGGAELVVADDGPPERRSAVLESLAERAATLNARFSSEISYPRGSTIRVDVPPSAASR
ncbi:MAG TPA: histidine kinase [Gaiellaceae bacterium]|nr:histidine kinase [Gaiellaceae bacterium]